MKLMHITALAAVIVGGLAVTASAQQPPSAGGLPPGGAPGAAGGPPGGAGGQAGPPGGGFALLAAPPFLTTLVPDMAATIEIETPGGLMGPQGTLRAEYSGINRPQGSAEASTPPFTWTAGPDTTKSYAIILQDFPSDRTMDGITQWAVLNIPAGTTSIPAGIAEGTEIPQIPGAVQFGRYVAPGPGMIPATVTPFGGEKELNLYAFEIYALDDAITVAEGASMSDLQAAMKGHVVAYGISTVVVQFGLNPPSFGPPPASGAPGGPGGAPPGGAPGAAPAGGPPPAGG